MSLNDTMYSLKALVSLSTTFNSSSIAAWSGGMTFLKKKFHKMQKKEILFVKSEKSEKKDDLPHL